MHTNEIVCTTGTSCSSSTIHCFIYQEMKPTAASPTSVGSLFSIRCRSQFHLHAARRQALLVAVTLHVLAIGLYWVAKRQNLLLPMITGRKVLLLGVHPPRKPECYAHYCSWAAARCWPLP
jgi:cytochrome b561